MISDQLRAELLADAKQVAAEAPPLTDQQRADLRDLIGPRVVRAVLVPATRPERRAA